MEAGFPRAEDARDLGDKVLDVGEFLDDHEAVDAGGEGVADAVDVVAGEVDEHDVLGAVFERVAEFVCELFVLGLAFAALDGAGDGVGDDSAGFGFDEEFWGGADNLKITAVDVKEVRGGVYGAEVAVDVEGVE